MCTCTVQYGCHESQGLFKWKRIQNSVLQLPWPLIKLSLAMYKAWADVEASANVGCFVEHTGCHAPWQALSMYQQPCAVGSACYQPILQVGKGKAVSAKQNSRGVNLLRPAGSDLCWLPEWVLKRCRAQTWRREAARWPKMTDGVGKGEVNKKGRVSTVAACPPHLAAL